MVVVMPGAEPLPRAEDDDEIVRRPAAAVVRWRLLVATDAVADQAHLAIALGHLKYQNTLVTLR